MPPEWRCAGRSLGGCFNLQTEDMVFKASSFDGGKIMKAGVRAHVKRSVVLSICIILLGLSFFSSVVKAGESKKSNVIEKNAKADGTEKDSETVRVGWYETPSIRLTGSGADRATVMSISRKLPLIQDGIMSM